MDSSTGADGPSNRPTFQPSILQIFHLHPHDGRAMMGEKSGGCAGC